MKSMLRMKILHYAALSCALFAVACGGGSATEDDDGGLPVSALDCRDFGASTEQAPASGDDWGGRGWQSCPVSMALPADGESLYATIFLPGDLRAAESQLPAVAIGPGAWPFSDKSSMDLQTAYHWSARELASYGYVVVTVNPRGFYNSAAENGEDYDEYVGALTLALKYLSGNDNPQAWRIDPTRLGLAGHSLSGRVSSVLQSEISGLAAIVAWDNLASDARGDEGSYARGNDRFGAPALAVQPRVPAMGQASDSYEPSLTAAVTEEDKKTAFDVWRNSGVEAMQVVFADAEHGDWSYALRDDEVLDAVALGRLRVFQYFTRAWFDLHLRGRSSAISKLTSPYVEEKGPNELYSQDFLSALYLIDQASYDCSDLLAGCGF